MFHLGKLQDVQHLLQLWCIRPKLSSLYRLPINSETMNYFGIFIYISFYCTTSLITDYKYT